MKVSFHIFPTPLITPHLIYSLSYCKVVKKFTKKDNIFVGNISTRKQCAL